MDDKTFENRAQMGPKTEHRRGTPSALGHDPMGYPRVPREKIRKKNQRNKKEGVVPQGPPILVEKAANMAPTWVPRWSQNGEKINAKIDQKFDASWDRFLMRF